MVARCCVVNWNPKPPPYCEHCSACWPHPDPAPLRGPDQRTPAERHGDALVGILHLAANSTELPTEAGGKPHVLVTVPLQTLREGVRTGLLDGTGDLDAASARRLACDNRVIPTVLSTNSETTGPRPRQLYRQHRPTPRSDPA
jgi:hypothetical protein